MCEGSRDERKEGLEAMACEREEGKVGLYSMMFPPSPRPGEGDYACDKYVTHEQVERGRREEGSVCVCVCVCAYVRAYGRSPKNRTRTCANEQIVPVIPQ